MVERLILLYFFLLPYVKLVDLPLFQAKLQLAEVVFVGMLLMLAYGIWKGHFPIRSFWAQLVANRLNRWLLAAFLTYILANNLAAYFSHDLDAYLEAIGRGYLVLLTAVIIYWIWNEGEVRAEKALQAWTFGALAMSVLTIGGYLLALFGVENALVGLVKNYPYLGDVWRARGLAGSGGMLALVLMVPVLFTWRRWREGKISIWPWAILFLVAGLSLSKELLLIVLGMALVDPKMRGLATSLRVGLVTSVMLVYLLGTHFLLLPQQAMEASYLNDTEFTSERVVLSLGGMQIVETSYTSLKKAAWQMGWDNLWWGVGPGQHAKHLTPLREEGHYPAHLPDYESHSSWLGAWAETGPLGLLSLLTIGILLIFFLQRGGQQLFSEGMTGLLSVYLLLILIESISVDTMNFRHLWAPLGLILGLYLLPSKTDPGLRPSDIGL